MEIQRQRVAFAYRQAADDGYTFHYHTDLDTVPVRKYHTDDEYVEDPYFYPPAIEARHNGQYVGSIEWTGDGADPLVKVHPDHRRKGLGSRLIQEALNREPKLNSENLTPMGAALMNAVDPGKKHTPNGPPEREEW